MERSHLTFVKGEEVPAVLLAAGQSRRLGRPKALVEIAEKALILRSWEELCSAGCAPVVVVLSLIHISEPTNRG